MRSAVTVNNPSSLLTTEENDTVFKLLGNSCKTLATAVVQLWTTDEPAHDRWNKRDTGALCFVKDNGKKSYYFRIYCPTKRALLWEHEIYTQIEYTSPKPYIHTFEGHDCMIAFNFASEEEAAEIKNVLISKQMSRQRRQRERRSRPPSAQQRPRPPPIVNDTVDEKPEVTFRNPPRAPPPIPNGGLYNKPTPQAPPVENVQYTKYSRKDKKGKAKLSKADIGQPQNFRHVSHVGWDPEKGFETTDAALQPFLMKAGVTEKELRDRDTRTFIYDFINSHGGIDAVKEESEPPPVPQRIIPTQNRPAPLPPSKTKAPLQPPVPTPIRGMPPPRPTQAPPPAAVPPPPPLPTGPMPPPPPPMAGLLEATNTTRVVTESSMPPPSSGELDPRSALMEAIRTQRPLKKVEVEERKVSGGDRTDLLSEIRQGIELKPVTVSNEPKPVDEEHSGLAGALARALKARAEAIHSDSDTSDTSSDGDEWDD